MQGDAPRSLITGVPGWETAKEQETLVAYAGLVPPNGRIVEIGGEFGMSASLFCKGAYADTHIITIDLFSEILLSKHKANLAEAGFTGRSEQIAGDSKVIGETWNRAIHLLFVDGDHSYEGALSDLTLYSRHVVMDGFVLIHDVAQHSNPTPHPLHYEVARAIETWITEGDGNNFAKVGSVDTLAIYQRVKVLARSVQEESLEVDIAPSPIAIDVQESPLEIDLEKPKVLDLSDPIADESVIGKLPTKKGRARKAKHD